MAFRNLFGKSRDAATPPPPEPDDAVDIDDDAEGGETIDAPEVASERSFRERAEAVLPTGASTGSKRAAALYGSDAADGPTHFSAARGAHLTDVDGRRRE